MLLSAGDGGMFINVPLSAGANPKNDQLEALDAAHQQRTVLAL
jgi:hypothetical protein